MSIGWTAASVLVLVAFVGGFWIGHYRGYCDALEDGWMRLLKWPTP